VGASYAATSGCDGVRFTIPGPFRP
jgi:hypothetical protein